MYVCICESDNQASCKRMPSGPGVAFLAPVEDPGQNFKQLQDDRNNFFETNLISRVFIHHLENAKKSTLIRSRVIINSL